MVSVRCSWNVSVFFITVILHEMGGGLATYLNALGNPNNPKDLVLLL